MRYVPSITPATTSSNTRQVKGLFAAYAVKPVHPREPAVPSIAAHQATAHPVEQQHHRDVPVEDRRKVSARVSHHPVLVELRSGMDRRRRNLRSQDIVEHIDEEA